MLKWHPNVKVYINYRLLFHKHNGTFQYHSLREKYRISELFLVRIQENTDQK